MYSGKLQIFILILILGGILNSGCSKNDRYIKSEGIIWNTIYHITYKGPENLKDSILPVLNEVSRSLSIFHPNSLVCQLNDNKSIKADRHFIAVYDESKRINEISGGNFDPTLSPLIDAWGFGLRHTPNSDTIAIDSILNFIGLSRTYRINDTIVKEDIRTRFNFSAIAKGYGCDAVAEMFSRNGVDDYMIEIGGEITLRGQSPSGKKWSIGIDAPVENAVPGEEELLILSLTDCGVATSGNYRNFRREGENIVAHTISPHTGRPFVSEILSATVVAGSCMEADGMATACMASSLPEAISLIQTNPVEGLLIFQDSIWMSPGFKDLVAK